MEKHNKLTIISASWDKLKKRTIATCVCDCGKSHYAVLSDIRSGNTKSCGCGRKGTNLKHGHARIFSYRNSTRTYRSWQHMKDRCYNKESKRYSDYGGRGITVCDGWLNSFESFLEDMGECPQSLQIDRIDNNGNYEKENCRWTTAKVNANNRRKPKATRWTKQCLL